MFIFWNGTVFVGYFEKAMFNVCTLYGFLFNLLVHGLCTEWKLSKKYDVNIIFCSQTAFDNSDLTKKSNKIQCSKVSKIESSSLFFCRIGFTSYVLSDRKRAKATPEKRPRKNPPKSEIIWWPVVILDNCFWCSTRVKCWNSWILAVWNFFDNQDAKKTEEMKTKKRNFKKSTNFHRRDRVFVWKWCFLYEFNQNRSLFDKQHEQLLLDHGFFFYA